MSYEFYKIIHVISILILFVSLTGYLYSSKRSYAIGHGLAMLFILVSGFGLLARLGLVSGLPKWVYIKLAVWFLLGGAFAFAKRKSLPAYVQVVLWLSLGFIAVFAVITKPFQ